MLKTFFLTVILLFAIPANEDWYIVLEKNLQEPGLDKLLKWVPEEVPRTVTFYFDTNEDGKYDIKIAIFFSWTNNGLEERGKHL